MECKPSTIHVLKVLKISYFGCSKRLFFSQLLLCGSQHAEGDLWVGGSRRAHGSCSQALSCTDPLPQKTLRV